MDLDLEYCDCGRSYCQFFNGAEGETGTSYTIEEVQEYLKSLPAIQKHLEKELALAIEASRPQDTTTPANNSKETL